MATATLSLDKRYESETKGHPIKISIYHAGKQYTVSTKLFATEGAYKKAFRSTAKDLRSQKLRDKLDNAKAKAAAILQKMGASFDIVRFKRMFYSEIQYQTKGAALFVNDLYQQRMSELEQHKQLKHLSAYQCSLKALITFKPQMTLQQITPHLLKEFEREMLGKGNSISTVFTYLRPLKTVFKKAIDDGLIHPETYPFGERKYVIGNSESARLALSPTEIKTLWHYPTKNAAQQRAKDFWFFIYFANGIAPVDVAHLTKQNLKNDYIIYQRKKSKRTKTTAKDALIPLTEELKTIIANQGNKTPDPYIFPILHKGMSEVQQLYAVEYFRNQTNKILRRIGKNLGLENSPCLYSGRHSFADALGGANVNLKTISDLLGQSTATMASNYIGNLRLERAKELQKHTSTFLRE